MIPNRRKKFIRTEDYIERYVTMLQITDITGQSYTKVKNVLSSNNQNIEQILH